MKSIPVRSFGALVKSIPVLLFGCKVSSQVGQSRGYVSLWRFNNVFLADNEVVCNLTMSQKFWIASHFIAEGAEVAFEWTSGMFCKY